MSINYKKSGVSLEEGYKAVASIKPHIERTKNKGVMSTIGGFGGCFDLSQYQVKEPILVSGTDGVGTKLRIAQRMNKHDTIGIDLVAMCVNDIVTVGAQPLFFLDYIATHKVMPDQIEQIVKGISEGCQQAGCALIGGETAEMNDFYQKDDYDLAGFVTGVVDKSKLITNESVREGQVLIGLASSGIHSNGYSLVRKIFFKDNNYALSHQFDQLENTLGEELLKSTKIYVKEIMALINEVNIHGIAHITGGGLIENIPRILPEGFGVRIDEKSLPNLPIFALISTLGKMPKDEMYNVFNMGIGMVVLVAQKDVEKALRIVNVHEPRVIGTVTSTPGVVFEL